MERINTMKSFLITIDTEGDNLWDWKEGQRITTNNSNYLARFQQLCNEYAFRPVWLSNWEMIHDNRFVEYFALEEERGNCEIGIHIHAWNTPPFYTLPQNSDSGAPYLIEYPSSVMEKKIDNITKEFVKVFGHRASSHRAGRWAINEEYFNLLYKFGYKVDCSVTPGIDWSTSIGQTPGFFGPNYSNEIGKPYVKKGVLEVPLTTFVTNYYPKETQIDLKGFEKVKYSVKRLLRKKRTICLRPNGKNLADMKWIVRNIEESDLDYLMFMIHSSELMPGGNPTFLDGESIEKLYEDINKLFMEISKSFRGSTLSEYYAKNRGLFGIGE